MVRARGRAPDIRERLFDTQSKWRYESPEDPKLRAVGGSVSLGRWLAAPPAVIKEREERGKGDRGMLGSSS